MVQPCEGPMADELKPEDGRVGEVELNAHDSEILDIL